MRVVGIKAPGVRSGVTDRGSRTKRAICELIFEQIPCVSKMTVLLTCSLTHFSVRKKSPYMDDICLKKLQFKHGILSLIFWSLRCSKKKNINYLKDLESRTQ